MLRYGLISRRAWHLGADVQVKVPKERGLVVGSAWTR